MPDESGTTGGAPSAPAAASSSSSAPSAPAQSSAPAASPSAAQPSQSAPSAPAASGAGGQQQGYASVADTFNQLMAEQPAEQPAAPVEQQPTAQAQQAEQQAEQPEGQQPADELPDFTLQDAAPVIDKLYTADEFNQLAQANPQQAWQYAQQLNNYVQETLPAIQGIQAVADKVGSIDTLNVLGDLAAAVFAPDENTPGNVYSTLLKLQEAYPDHENGPLAQMTRSLATFRAPEVIGALGDQLPKFLDGSHPYLNIETYAPANEYDRYQAQTYINKLQSQRAALLEQIAPVAYKQHGNDFALRDQYKNVGPEGEYFGLADNTIDKDVRSALPEDLRSIYDGLPPSVRGKINAGSDEEIQYALGERKGRLDAENKTKAMEAQFQKQTDDLNAKIEAQVKEQESKRVESWESQNDQYIADRLTKTYKLDPYAARVIQRDLKDFVTTDAKVKPIYEQAKAAAKAGNQPLLSRLMGDLERHAEGAIRRSLQEWQKATGQRAQRATVAPADPKNPAIPIYPNSNQPQRQNGADRQVASVADTINELFNRSYEPPRGA